MRASGSHPASVDPARLRPHYQAFLRPGRILLTGHSHQAWPDVARAGMLRAFEDAAEHVDDKWSRAFAQADRVRAAVAAVVGGAPTDVALASNSHELACRFLSALDLRARPHLVTTDGEFHSLARQLSRLAEAGVEVSVISADPVSTLAERLAAAVRPRTAAVLASTVLFRTAARVPGLAQVTEAAHAVGAFVLFDAYHQFGVFPFAPDALGDGAFVTGGGYKYAQWGEGCCWMVVPPGCRMRPIFTGWFSEFGTLAAATDAEQVRYGEGGAWRFAGSTYDPTSHYRAAAVIDFFAAQGLTGEALAAGYARQTERLRQALPDLQLLSPVAARERGGFLAFRVKAAATAVARLREVGIYVDARGEILRLGPAPYLTDDELDAGAFHVRAVLDSM